LKLASPVHILVKRLNPLPKSHEIKSRKGRNKMTGKTLFTTLSLPPAVSHSPHDVSKHRRVQKLTPISCFLLHRNGQKEPTPLKAVNLDKLPSTSFSTSVVQEYLSHSNVSGRVGVGGPGGMTVAELERYMEQVTDKHIVTEARSFMKEGGSNLVGTG
jgi:hypothetical protein